MPHDEPGHEGPCIILVIEDELIIALDLIDLLEEAGFVVKGPAATVAAALILLDHEHPDAAVLDLNLGHEWSTPVAEALHRRGVPFLISSGRRPEEMPEDEVIRQAPKLLKPTTAGAIVRGVTDLLTSKPVQNS